MSTKFDVHFTLTEEFRQQSFIWKNIYIICAMQIVVARLFFVFIGPESFLIASGMGYKPPKFKRRGDDRDEPYSFNNYRVVKIKECWFMESLQKVTVNWNMQVHLWLKHYVLFRLIDRSKKGSAVTALITTYMVSAVWHGIEPGYLIFFFALAI